MQAASFNRAVSFTDPGPDVWSATVDYGDGTAGETPSVNQNTKTFALSHAYAVAGVYPVTVIVNDGDGSTTATFTVTVQRLVTDWRMTHFGTTSNSGDAADTADIDRDGLSNLVEFAFNLDPKAAGSSQLPAATLAPALPDDHPTSARNVAPLDAGSPGQNFAIRFDEPPGISGITYGAEYTTNLQTWLPIADDGADGTHLFWVPVGTNTRIFMRLTVTATSSQP
jgi:PKD repeat protein